HAAEHKPSHNWFGVGNDSLVGRLKRHALALLTDPQRRNIAPDGGLKLSSTSDDPWLSKTAIIQHVARVVLRLDDDEKVSAILAGADAANVKWQSETADHSADGKRVDDRHSPRAITTALWMDKAAR